VCRHTAWLGQPRSLASLLVEPPHGLVRQSWEPRRQRYGTVNADGFGIGWYAAGSAVRYRRAVPVWGDASFASLAPAVRSTCVLAAVRSATVGGPGGEEACAPFLLPGEVLLSHNGAVPVDLVAPLVPSRDLAAIGSTVDSAFLAALVSARLAGGLRPALAAVVRQVGALAPAARLNLVATDGTSLAATAWGDTLFWRTGGGGVVVASEPSDDEPGWTEVADRSLLHVTADGVVLEDLS
jgi:glutamine amidotransferase